ncbi:hypothetical protein LOTGIDRAFT_160993 [Lottia gigantea]|uniref:DNA-directed DNA polymerase n=1 Tax=Lottia gigantea TaxID=225164 RepID=V4AMA6_LOTGI|nr:hypothetical protein LOTGIDRAFT_160993 [Lottia gigantea]ESO94751.1 hypothetical protein LOTGIDRAFT_160993 [Lottia gigantea]
MIVWDCETYSEKETNKAIPYSCTLINLESRREILDRIKHNFPDLNPTDSVPEEFYNKLMNIVEIFVGKDCIDQMLQHLGKIDKKRITLISHNEIKNNYDENVWRTCRDDNAVTQVSPLKLNQHEKSSLAAWGNSSNLPMNLRKITDINIAKYTEDNWESLRHKWEPYAKRDTLCLGACLIKYNKVMKEVVFQNISNNLTAPSLSFKGWYYLYHYNKEMVEEEWYESTRMVPKHTEKENVEKVYSHTHPFIRYFIRQSIKGGRVSANRKSFETNKMDEICNILKEFISQSETPSDNIIDLFKEYSKSKKDKTEVNSKLKKIKCTKLMAFDANSLYTSAMSDL